MAPTVDAVIVDMANVVGSRPDGWWRDRAGAAGRLAARIVAALDSGVLAPLAGDGVVHLVLEGKARPAVVPEHPRVRVHLAEHDGDAAIAELAGALDGSVVVVTADRGLRQRVQAVGATTVGPDAVLRLLPS